MIPSRGTRPELRPLRPADAPAVRELAHRAFGAIYPEPPPSPERIRAAELRITHLAATDPAGALVAVLADGTIEGAALAVRRAGLWFLSLLVVEPGSQSRGTGRRLLARARETAAGAAGELILSSKDPRALRLYAETGLAPHPALSAEGPVRHPPAPPPDVRAGTVEDRSLVETVDSALRGVPRGADLDVSLAQGSALLVHLGRGYALHGPDGLRQLGALDPAAAQDLLRAVLAAAARAGHDAEVDWITAEQGWAVPVVLEAGLRLALSGAVFRRGETGRFVPYLPSGAFG